MLSSLSRFTGKDCQHGERSPFSSPFSGRLSTPVAARRSSLEERPRPAAGFNHEVSLAPASPIDEGDEAVDGDVNNDEDEDEDEDGGGETSPLLPIFSAAHLGQITDYHRDHWANANLS